MENHIICFGGAILDNIYTFEAVEIIMGNANLAGVRTIVGGVALNMARLLSKFDNSVKLFSVVGNDSAGQRIMQELEQHNIDTSLMLIDEKRPTASYGALHNTKGELVLAAVAKDIYRDVTPQVVSTHLPSLRKAKTWVIESTFKPEIMNFLAHSTYKPDIYLTICGADEGHHIIPLIPCANGVFGNVDEITLLAKRFEPNIIASVTRSLTDAEIWQAMRVLQQNGVQNIFCTHDVRGVFVLADSEQYYHPAPDVKVVCVNGAGDAFAAAVINCLTKGRPLQHALKDGIAAAAAQLEGREFVPAEYFRNTVTFRPKAKI